MVGDECSCCACDGAFISWLRHCAENRRLCEQAWLRRGSRGRYGFGRVGQGHAGMAQHALLMGHSALHVGGHVFHVCTARAFRGACRGVRRASRRPTHVACSCIEFMDVCMFVLQCHAERRTWDFAQGRRHATCMHAVILAQFVHWSAGHAVVCL